MTEMRKCTRCGNPYKQGGHIPGRNDRGFCHECRLAVQRERQRVIARRERQMRQGMPPETVREILEGER